MATNLRGWLFSHSQPAEQLDDLEAVLNADSPEVVQADGLRGPLTAGAPGTGAPAVVGEGGVVSSCGGDTLPRACATTGLTGRTDTADPGVVTKSSTCALTLDTASMM